MPRIANRVKTKENRKGDGAPHSPTGLLPPLTDQLLPTDRRCRSPTDLSAMISAGAGAMAVVEVVGAVVGRSQRRLELLLAELSVKLVAATATIMSLTALVTVRAVLVRVKAVPEITVVGAVVTVPAARMPVAVMVTAERYGRRWERGAAEIISAADEGRNPCLRSRSRGGRLGRLEGTRRLAGVAELVVAKLLNLGSCTRMVS